MIQKVIFHEQPTVCIGQRYEIGGKIVTLTRIVEETLDYAHDSGGTVYAVHIVGYSGYTMLFKFNPVSGVCIYYAKKHDEILR